MNQWQKNARDIVKGFATADTESERIAYLEHLADSSTDLAVWEEILRLAVIGAIFDNLAWGKVARD